jgi:hypothetical protein
MGPLACASCYAPPQVTTQVQPQPQALPQNQTQPQTQSQTNPAPTVPQPTEGTQKTIVDLGSGTEGLWARGLKKIYPNDRVIATESGDNFGFLQMNLAGSGIEVINGGDNVPSEIADQTWAVAPQTGVKQPILRIPEGQAGLRITKPGGVFHMVVLYSEISNRYELDAELSQISPTQKWNVQIVKIGWLGIPSQYYNRPKDDAWYITADKR